MEKISSRNSAVLIGCNYPNSEDSPQGCMVGMRATLITKLGFDPNFLELMTDAPGSTTMPTGANIRTALNRVIEQARTGDVLFLHFSGHGMALPSENSTRKIEAIVPSDFNLITNECVDFRHLVDKVPRGATFAILSDSCNSGGLIDKETEQIGPNHPPHGQMNVKVSGGKAKLISYESMLQKLSSMTGLNCPDIGVHLMKMFGQDASLMFRLSPGQFPKPLEPNQGILLSGCQSDELSDDVPRKNEGEGYGAFSNAVEIVLKGNSGSTNRKIVIMSRKILERSGHDEQHPCLYCSKENADAIFLHTTRNP